MQIELTETQVQMLEALLFMTLPEKSMRPDDRAELDDLQNKFNVWTSISPFDADSKDCLSGIELWRSF